MEELGEEGFEDLEEQEQAYDTWLRSSPLPRVIEEQRKKDSNSSSCSKSLFNISSSQSRCDSKARAMEGEEGEVEQDKGIKVGGSGVKALMREDKEQEQLKTGLEVEAVAESLGVVGLSTSEKGTGKKDAGSPSKIKKWTRRQANRKVGAKVTKKQMGIEMGKR